MALAVLAILLLYIQRMFKSVCASSNQQRPKNLQSDKKTGERKEENGRGEGKEREREKHTFYGES